MRIRFLLTETDTSATLTLAIDGEHYTVPDSHVRYTEIHDLALTARRLDADELAEVGAKLVKMINAGQEAVDTMRALSERVSYLGGVVYFDGDPVDNALTEHIVNMVKAGDENWSAPVAFLENLMANPARHVHKRLFEWIGQRGLTLTPEGLVVGYKGVRSDEHNSSITAGSNTVWVDGTAHTGHIPNPIGATLVMSRAEVDNNRDAECSQGLHVGTWDYANSFGNGHVLTVTFNPRDVIAIPKGEGHSKIRVCRYTVQEVSHGKRSETTYTGPVSVDVEPEEDEEDEDSPYFGGF